MAAITTNSMNLVNNTERRNIIISDLISKEYNNSANKNNTFILKLSYDHPLGNEHLLETGYEGTFKVLKMNSKYSRFNMTEQKWTDIPSRKIMNKYAEQSHNIYGQVNGTLYDVKYSIGLSYDKYHLRNEELINGKYFEGNYSGLIPWISFSKKLFPGHTISISFTSKSYYPENRQINPYIDYTDSTELRMGNPDLKPFYNKTVALNYRITLQDLFMRIGASYSNISNKIELITSQENRLLAVTTYKNLSSLKSLQTYIYANKKLAEWLILEPQFNFYNQEYKSPDVKNNIFTWNSFLRTSISFNTFKFQIDFRYSSPDISAQSKTKSNFYANAAMKALFFDKHLSLSLNTEDIFNTVNQNLDIYGKGFYSINKRNETTRIISLGISYYFQKRADDAIEEPEEDEYDDF